ncbi:MAG TPA: hypothetical protein VFC26_09880, partial [Verrucomicrobiae bacterium]|nr:hypothetical protein [Verrucomicrobiae bacterium]
GESSQSGNNDYRRGCRDQQRGRVKTIQKWRAEKGVNRLRRDEAIKNELQRPGLKQSEYDLSKEGKKGASNQNFVLAYLRPEVTR